MRVGKQIRLRDKQRGYLSAAMKLILFGGVAPSFELPLNDKGAGEVNLVPSRASGSGTPTFTRATTAYTTLADGSLYQVASGVPRSCYSAAGVYLGYLAEGARTNLCLQSNSLTTTWASGGTPSATQDVTGPDGATSAWTLTDNDAGAVEFQFQSISITSGTTYTFSAYVKKTVGALTAYPQFSIFQSTGPKRAGCTIDTTAGTAVAWTSYTGSTILTQSVVVRDAGTFWRVELTFTAGSTESSSFVLVPAGTNVYSGVGDGVVSATGAAVFFGVQLEAASFASTYSPTTTAATTRNADIDDYPSASNIATVGAFVADFTPASATTRTGYIFGSYTDANNSVALLFDGTNLIARKRIGGTDYDATIAYTMVAGTTVKVGMRWGADGVDVWLNGVKGTGNANATTAVIAATFQFGADGNSANQPFGNIKNGKAYPRAVNDGKMGSLTT